MLLKWERPIPLFLRSFFITIRVVEISVSVCGAVKVQTDTVDNERSFNNVTTVAISYESFSGYFHLLDHGDHVGALSRFRQGNKIIVYKINGTFFLNLAIFFESSFF